MPDLQHSAAKRQAMLCGLAGHHGREGFGLGEAEAHGLPSETLPADLKELVTSGKLVERTSQQGDPRWAKNVTFKAFGDTRTNAQLMAWRQQMMTEYGMLDFKMNKPASGPGTHVVAPWARSRSPRPPVKPRKQPRVVQLFLHKMLRVAERRKGANGGTLHNYLRRVFMAMDTDGSGKLNRTEFHRAAREELGLRFSRAEEDAVFGFFDTDGGGTVSWAELFAEVKVLEALKMPWPNERQASMEVCSARRRLGRRPNAVVGRFRKALIEYVRRRGKLHGIGAERALGTMLDAFDEDGSGLLSAQEIIAAARTHLGWRDMTPVEANDVLQWYDVEGRGGASRTALMAEAKDPTCGFAGLEKPVWYWAPPTARPHRVGDLYLPPRVHLTATRPELNSRSARAMSAASARRQAGVPAGSSSASRPRSAAKISQKSQRPPGSPVESLEKRALDAAIASARQAAKATARPASVSSSRRPPSRRSLLTATGVLSSRSGQPEAIASARPSSATVELQRRQLLAEKLRVENELLRLKIRAKEMQCGAGATCTALDSH